MNYIHYQYVSIISVYITSTDIQQSARLVNVLVIFICLKVFSLQITVKKL